MENAQKTAKLEAAALKKRKRAEVPALRGVRQAPKKAVLKVREAVPALRKEKIKQTGAEPAKMEKVKVEPAKMERAEVKRKTALRLILGQMIAEQTGNPGTVLT